MGCPICGNEQAVVARALGACVQCLRAGQPQALATAARAHSEARRGFDLPERPDDPNGALCRLCANECRIPRGGWGFCGLRTNRDGTTLGLAGLPRRGLVDWYHDPLPTNCVADWVCPAGTGVGFPQHAYRSGPERGYTNLAVFYRACTFDCLFCQNWHFRQARPAERGRSADELVEAVDGRTACICFFGGDPSAQMPHAIAASRRALERNRGRILRICWETNGSMHPRLLDAALELSLRSGGCVKFDLKASNRHLHRALTSCDNERTFENFERAARRLAERPAVPLVVASTLLVPGYVDEHEVGAIATFIARIDRTIPYALLAFHPCFAMSDLPTTRRSDAEACLRAARDAGLTTARVGNLHLLA